MLAVEALAGPSRHALRCPLRHLRPIRRYQSTGQSPSSQSQSPKICAAPFLLDPAAAAHKLHMNALIASAKGSNLFLAALLKLFGPGVGAIAKQFGLGDSVEMRNMKAVYWPVWRVDALLEGSVESKGKEGPGLKAYMAVQEAYIPGNAWAPLSYLSFAVPPLPDGLPEYDPKEHLTQLGEGFEIVPVPFAVSPFAVVDKLRRVVGKRATFEQLAIDETRWKEHMIACYPIYMPIYVAEFEQKRPEGDRRYPVIMDAHDSDISQCRASWPPPEEVLETGRFMNNYFVNPAPFIPEAHLIMPFVRPTVAGPPMSPNSLNRAYTSWLSPAPSSSTSIAPSPLVDITDPINWDDPRIQSWSGVERDQNYEYYDKAQEVWKSLGVLDGIAQLKSQLGDGADPQALIKIEGDVGAQPRPMSEIKKKMEEDVEKTKAELLGLKPTWLVEWEEAKRVVEEGKK